MQRKGKNEMKKGEKFISLELRESFYAPSPSFFFTFWDFVQCFYKKEAVQSTFLSAPRATPLELL